MTETIDFINARLAEAEAVDRLPRGEGVEPDSVELPAVLEEWI